MKIKAVVNRTDSRQESYIKYLERTFPEIMNEENPDMYYVIGGDGAMLHAHTKYGKFGKPFLGKGFGTINFVMNNFENDFEVIDGLLNDSIKPTVIKTEKIKVVVKKANGEKIVKEAINDIVIGNGIMDWHNFLISSERGSFNNLNFRGMGLCVATPLGSTAFNLNNGGKVLPPDSDIWSITGVVSDRKIDEIMIPQEIVITIKSERHIPVLYVDGTATSIPLEKDDKVKLKKCKDKFNLAFIDPKIFFGKRTKLIQSKR